MSFDAEAEEMLMELPSMETEEGRKLAIDFLIDRCDMDDENDYCRAAVIQEGEDMVIRFRYPDGREEVFDVLVRGSREIVRKAPEGESN